jgi:predicted AlkP superfamily pyrophosphatase or phosphodiesterase
VTFNRDHPERLAFDVELRRLTSNTRRETGRGVVDTTLEPTALEWRSPLWAITGMMLSMAAGCAPAASSPGPSEVSSSALPAAAPPASTPEPPGPIRHVIVITIDGLMPDSYRQPDAHGLKIPTLRRLVAEGASSSGALSVFPSVTYPAHTSMATGVIPRRHGIVSNRDLDPLQENPDGWRRFAEDVAVPRVWDVASAAGYRTALIEWPVTVGARATFIVPDARSRTPNDLKLMRALSTPGLFPAVAAAYPNFDARFRPGDISDEGGTDIAVHVLVTGKPHLTFLHIFDVDGAQHEHGIWSDEARAAIENADRQIGRLLEATERADIAGATALVVASDHGFAPVTRCVNPNTLLANAGLLERGGQGRVRDWQAVVHANGGSAYVYTRRPGDAQLEAAVLKVLEDEQRAGRSGIARIIRREEIDAIGGDPQAFLALEAELGAFFGGDLERYETVPSLRGMHGYDPGRPEMKASLILFGPTIAHGELASARLVDIAPTVASWLGLELAGVDGKPLEIVAGAPRVPAASGR